MDSETQEKYNIIRDVIANKLQVTAMYGGHYREMCPHTIGMKGETPQALFYQFAGDSSQGPLPEDGEWRCMRIALLTDIETHEGEWHTSPEEHTQEQNCVDVIDLEVEY